MIAKKISCFFMVFLLISMNFLPVLAVDPPVSGDPEPVPFTTSFSCSSPDSDPNNILNAKQVEQLKQKMQVDADGFSGSKISSGSAVPNQDRAELGNPRSSIVIPTGKGDEAVLQKIPTGKFDASEIKHLLSKSINGPYAAGLSLDDTLRIGRCNDLDAMNNENIPCPLAEDQLSLRNSGEGIVSDFKTLGKDFGNIFGEISGFISDDSPVDGLTQEQAEIMRTNMAGEVDPETMEIQTYKRPQESVIPNSLKTETFSVKFGSSCNTGACLISSYTMFDKYFNSWFSADLVIGAFGPTLFGQAKRYLYDMPRARGAMAWPWQISQLKFLQSIRRNVMDPSGFLGKQQVDRMVTRVRKYGFGKDFWDKMMYNADWDSGYKAFKGGSFKKFLEEMTSKGGYLDEMKDPKLRGEFFKLVQDLRLHSRTQKNIVDQSQAAFTAATKKFGQGSPEAIHAMKESARTNYRLMDAIDNGFSLDFPEWWLRDPFANLYPFAVKNSHSNSVVTLVSDSQHIDSIGNVFVKDGHFNNLMKNGSKSYETTADGALQLYEVAQDGRFLGDIAVEDLKKHFTRFKDKMVITEKGEHLFIDATNLDLIAGGSSGMGKVKVYEAKWAKGPTLTPEQFASKVTHSRVYSRFNNYNMNMEDLYKAVVEKNFAGMSRKYYSVLDRAIAREDEILKTYFSIKGGAKWTVQPFVYWGAKRGFGSEEFSGYMLPDYWNEIQFELGDAPLYNDAFVDFFAQHGSDEGDLLRQVLNKLPWEMVYNKIADQFEPIKGAYNKLTGEGWRSKVENIAFFTSTGDECPGCWANLAFASPESRETGKGDIKLSFYTNSSLDSFILEDAITKKAREEGTTIIAFGHHLNVQGKEEEGQDLEKTDLVEAQKEGETCRDKVKDIGLGWVGENPARAGAMMALTESLGYAFFGWSGIIGSAIQQTLIAPKLKDCVDDIDGYFVHIFAPTSEEQESQKTGTQKAAETSTDWLRDLTDSVLGEEKEDGGTENAFEAAKRKIREQVEMLEEQQRSNTILQASIETKGRTDAVLYAKEMFLFWFKGETNAARYDKESVMKIEDPESEVTITVDNKKGEILVNGVPIITSEDIVRMASPNLSVPAIEVPQRIGKIGLPTDSTVPIFEWDVRGQFTVVSPEVLDCIKLNIYEQTGLRITSGNIRDAFGEVKSIITDTYTVSVDSKNMVITGIGAPRRLVSGSNARVEVLANRQVTLKNGKEAKVGFIESVQFKHGVIVYKPETNEFIIWLKRNAKTIANKSDISGLNATPTVVKNPITDCPEPAINLDALPVAGSPAIAERVNNLNIGLQKQGPFQIFDTDKHRFMFYSKLLDDGSCEDRVKIINKETGEVYDQAIVGPIANTPEGISFRTEDGKDHTLDFDASDGVPKISYNNGNPEVLQTAQGPNGSFWYDPNTNQWYAENAQLIPLIDAIRQKGLSTSVGPDGAVSSIASGNSLSVNIGSSDTMPFNLPSLPENPLLLALFVSCLLAVMVVFRIGIERGKGFA